MLEQKQQYLHRPSEGIIGDCFRTCVACVLDIDRNQVPHDYRDYWIDEETNVTLLVHRDLNRWLNQGGFNVRFVEYPIAVSSQEELRIYIKHYYKDIHVLIGCNSKNGGHSVVMKNEDYLWDPSLDGSGCVGPMDDGYYWIGLFVRT